MKKRHLIQVPFCIADRTRLHPPVNPSAYRFWSWS